MSFAGQCNALCYYTNKAMQYWNKIQCVKKKRCCHLILQNKMTLFFCCVVVFGSIKYMVILTWGILIGDFGAVVNACFFQYGPWSFFFFFCRALICQNRYASALDVSVSLAQSLFIVTDPVLEVLKFGHFSPALENTLSSFKYYREMGEVGLLSMVKIWLNLSFRPFVCAFSSLPNPVVAVWLVHCQSFHCVLTCLDLG